MTGTNIAVRGAVLAAAVLALSACGDRSEAPDAAETPPADALAETETNAGAVDQPAVAPAPAATANADGAPPFAAVYPGARLQGPAVTSRNETERGGMVTFVTPDHPEAVIAFYRDRAEASGLASAMTMTQGETQIFGARAEGVGAHVQVVATPVDGETSVQLTWSSGG